MMPLPQIGGGGIRCEGVLYQNRMTGHCFFVFHFSELLYYNNARNKEQHLKGAINMKTIHKIEQLLEEYYDTFKH